MGPAACGKTSLINRIVNHSFPLIYEPTTTIENSTILYNISDLELKEKTFVMLTLQDFFGFNNPLLQTQEEFVTSKKQGVHRKYMADAIKEIMFTSNERRKKLNELLKKTKKDKEGVKEKTKMSVYEQILNNGFEVEVRGFIFVMDCNDKDSLGDLMSIIEKIHSIEKGNALFYPKCIMLNKIDKLKDKKILKEMQPNLDHIRERFKCDTYKVSAFTNIGVSESFKKFVSKIHMQEIQLKENSGFDQLEEEEVKADKVFKTPNQC